MIPFRKSSYNNSTVASSSPQQPHFHPSLELFQRGWLIHETLVQLKLHGGSTNSLQIWKNKHKNKDLYIKVTPIETRRSSLGNAATSCSRQNSIDMMEESTDISQTRANKKIWPVVEVAVMNRFTIYIICSTMHKNVMLIFFNLMQFIYRN